MKRLPIFETFVEHTQKILEPFLKKYSFECVSEQMHGTEFSIVYRRLDLIALRISWEPSSKPWIMVTAACPKDHVKKSIEAPLSKIATHRCPHDPFFNEVNDTEVEVFLLNVRNMLETNFLDILTASDPIGEKIGVELNKGAKAF